MKVLGIEFYSKLLIPSSVFMLRSNKMEVICIEMREIRAVQKTSVSIFTDKRFFGNKRKRKTGTTFQSVVLKRMNHAVT